MMEELKNSEPVLTLNPFEEIREEPQAPAVPAEAIVAAESAVEEKKEAPVFDESTLTPEERKMVDDFAKSIDLKNSAVVLQYGAGAQKKIADFFMQIGGWIDADIHALEECKCIGRLGRSVAGADRGSAKLASLPFGYGGMSHSVVEGNFRF